jgi:hypothetical protein
VPFVGEVRVEGLRDLQNAFREVSKDLAKELRTDLKQIAEPVRSRAEQLAGDSISNIGPVWSLMRVGVTQRTVYVAPKTRRTIGSPRSNLGGLLMRKAMQPALEEKTDQVAAELEKLVDRVTSRF